MAALRTLENSPSRRYAPAWNITLKPSTYDKFPVVKVSPRAADVSRGWAAISDSLRRRVGVERAVIAIETYPGVNDRELLTFFREQLKPTNVIETSSALKPTSAK